MHKKTLQISDLQGLWCPGLDRPAVPNTKQLTKSKYICKLIKADKPTGSQAGSNRQGLLIKF